jgi:hypothetical protein
MILKKRNSLHNKYKRNLKDKIQLLKNKRKCPRNLNKINHPNSQYQLNKLRNPRPLLPPKTINKINLIHSHLLRNLKGNNSPIN